MKLEVNEGSREISIYPGKIAIGNKPYRSRNRIRERVPEKNARKKWATESSTNFRKKEKSRIRFSANAAVNLNPGGDLRSRVVTSAVSRAQLCENEAALGGRNGATESFGRFNPLLDDDLNVG
jgi:hypothetical protein